MYSAMFKPLLLEKNRCYSLVKNRQNKNLLGLAYGYFGRD